MTTAQTILLCAALSAAVFLGLAVGRYACEYSYPVGVDRPK